jgi:hypothetical protein
MKRTITECDFPDCDKTAEVKEYAMHLSGELYIGTLELCPYHFGMLDTLLRNRLQGVPESLRNPYSQVIHLWKQGRQDGPRQWAAEFSEAAQFSAEGETPEEALCEFHARFKGREDRPVLFVKKRPGRQCMGEGERHEARLCSCQF